MKPWHCCELSVRYTIGFDVGGLLWKFFYGEKVSSLAIKAKQEVGVQENGKEKKGKS